MKAGRIKTMCASRAPMPNLALASRALSIFDTFRLLQENKGFFDRNYYRRSAKKRQIVQRLAPFTHYICIGMFQNLSPNGIFNVDYYRATNNLPSGENAVRHYLKYGWQQGKKPHELFDVFFYLNQYKDVAQSRLEPLSHYLRLGWKQGYNPYPFFDVSHYLHAYQDIRMARIEPLQHYITAGASEARHPNAIFKPDHYIIGQTDKSVTLENALVHFEKNSSPELRQLYLEAEKIRLRAAVSRIDTYAIATGQPVIDFASDRNHVWKSPLIINRDRARYDIRATLPKQYVAILQDVIAFPGTRLLVTSDKKILHDELSEEFAPTHQDKLKAIGDYTNGVCTISAVRFKVTLDEALMVSSDTDFNYFHMLVETLPKISLAEQAGCPVDVPIIMQGDLHPNLRSALERVAGSRQISYFPSGAAIEVKKLWYVSDLSRVLNTNTQTVDEDYDIAICPDAVRSIRQVFLGGHTAQKGTRKIYLSRNSHYRHLTNQDAFMEMLVGKGFDIIDTGSLTLQEQIGAMEGVGLIIAPTGAALTNLLWCAPGTTVLILVGDHNQMNLNIFNQVGEPLGVNVEFCYGNRSHQMEGKHSVHDSFEIDINVVSQWCDNQKLQR
jgi:capsular polysaccharide biosynthesis protein